MAGGECQLVQQVENSPDADTKTVFPPCIVARVRRWTELGGGVAEGPANFEMFNIERDVDGQPFAVRPGIIGPLTNRRVVVAIVIF